jgi:small subunit ribosomal protein S4e
MNLKRYAAPKSWKISRKASTWTVKPKPGPHKLKNCLPLQLVLRESLGYAETAREARKIIMSGKVLVDKKPRKEPAFPVGIMDVIEFPEAKAAYRVVVGKKGLEFEKIKPDETGSKLCRIEGKRTLGKDTTQLNLHDGRNITVKGAKGYNIRDSLLISLPEQKIIKHFKFDKGVPAVIIAGRNMGIQGKVKDFKPRKTMMEKATATVQSKDKAIQTLIDYVMVGEAGGARKKE